MTRSSRRTLSLSLLAAGALALPAFAFAAGPAASGGTSGTRVEVHQVVRHDISMPLRSMVPIRPTGDRKFEVEDREVPVPRPGRKGEDPVLQRGATTPLAAATVLSFDGVGTGFTGPQGPYDVSVSPPDTNGQVGPNHYIQWVNLAFAIFDKATGKVLYGPASGSTLWKGFGGKCEQDNDGDPIAQYDRVADRWVMSQFTYTGGAPYYQCVAISTSPDPMGSYYRYAYEFKNFPDYGKFAVWPDGYYGTFNMFNGPMFLGSSLCAFDRAKMLQGSPAAAQCVQVGKGTYSTLVADLDGPTQPPVGSPAYVFSAETNALSLWRYHVDWTDSTKSTLSAPTSIPMAAYNSACGSGGACVPQVGTRQKLDSLGGRLMYRAAYRNFGDHESVVGNLSSDTSSGAAAVRWFEVRGLSSSPSIYQQGTYAPDDSFRWMGSIAQDRFGNIALGYSVSSSVLKPGLRFAGRTPSDPLGTLSAEESIIEGGGSQQRALARWGDYSSLNVDPSDDCTFWFTSEYLKADGTYNWSTRIASFRLPGCIAK